MVSNKQEFMVMYDQAVDLLKKFKHKNDSLNKSIGVEHDSSVSLKIRAEQSLHSSMIKRLDEILQKLQQSYLDPDTARKIGTVKQQYKIQKDRRSHLIQSLGELQETTRTMPQENSQSDNYIRYTLANTHDRSSKFSGRRQSDYHQQSQNSTVHTINKHNQEQITEYDYEIECKLLKEKNQSLEETQKKLINVYNITKETKEMVDFQGEHLDIISDEIFKTRQNTIGALKEIKEANIQSKKRRKKIAFLSLFLLLAVLFVFGILFV